MKLLHIIRKWIIYKVLRLRTVGVRVIILSADKSKVLLVRHRYNDLWVFPGGAVSHKITPLQSAKKEAQEEVGIDIYDPLVKLGEYHNSTGGKNDTVFVFVVTNWQFNTKKRRIIDKIEVAEQKWFNISNLPPTTSQATRNRITEMMSNQKNLNCDW